MSHGSQDGYQRLRDYSELEESLHLPTHHHGDRPPSAASSPGRSSIPGLLGLPQVRPVAPPSTTSSSTFTASAAGRSHHGARAKKKGRWVHAGVACSNPSTSCTAAAVWHMQLPAGA